MASLTQWTWVWANSGIRWRNRKPGMLQFTGLQRVRHDLVTEQRWTTTLKNTTDRKQILSLKIKKSTGIREGWGNILSLFYVQTPSLWQLVLKHHVRYSNSACFMSGPDLNSKHSSYHSDTCLCLWTYTQYLTANLLDLHCL